jgi:hypothetical protein
LLRQGPPAHIDHFAGATFALCSASVAEVGLTDALASFRSRSQI